jgi:hypothetical protein
MYAKISTKYSSMLSSVTEWLNKKFTFIIQDKSLRIKKNYNLLSHVVCN